MRKFSWFEGSQAVLAHPSSKQEGEKVKALEKKHGKTSENTFPLDYEHMSYRPAGSLLR
jgi:hypothetical protein